MEKLLGIKEDRHRIPITTAQGNEGVVYVQDDGSKVFDEQFDKLFNASNPSQKKYGRNATHGSISNYKCKLFIPLGFMFHAVYYFGDTIGWRHDIEAGAKSLGLLTATIQKDTIVLSDGRAYKLSDCKIEDDLRHKEDNELNDSEADWTESESVSQYRANAMLEQIDTLEEAAKALLKGFDQKIALEAIKEYEQRIQKDPKLWSDLEVVVAELLSQNKAKESKEMEYYLTIVGEIMQSAK